MEKYKRTIKRIAALAGGAAMMGATFAGALAQIEDLPMPFVTDAGVFDAYVVVGTLGWNPNVAFNAQAATNLAGDVSVGIDVGAAFAQRASTGAGGGGGGTISGGKLIEQPGNAFGYTEEIEDIDAIYGDDDLPDLLKDERFKESKGASNNDLEYTQRIEFATGTGTLIVGEDTESDNDRAGQYLFFAGGVDPTWTYTINFDKDVVYDDTSSATADADFEGSRITILGRQYTILDVTLALGVIDEIEMVSGAVEATQGEYTTQTYTLNGNDYEVEVIIVSDSALTAKFRINGETTDALAEGDTYELADGTEIIVTEVLPNEGSEAAGADQVTFFLGANKVTLQAGDEVLINDEDIDDWSTTVTIVDAGGAMEEISITVSPDDDHFLAAGEWLIDPIFGNWGIYLAGFETGASEEIKATTSGDDGKLTVYNNNNKKLDFIVFHDDGSGDVVFGDEDFFGLVEDGDGTATADWAMLVDDTDDEGGTDGSANTCDGDCEGIMLLAVSATGEAHLIEVTDINAGDATVDLKDWTTGKTYDDEDADGVETIDLGFMTIILDVDSPSNGAIEAVSINEFDTAVGVAEFLTSQNALVTLTGTGVANVAIAPDEGAEAADDFDFEEDTGLDDVEIDLLSVDVFPEEEDSDWSIGAYDGGSVWGNWWRWNNEDKNSLTVTSYAELRDDIGVAGNVYIAPVGATVSGGTSGAVNINYFNAATGVSRTDADFAAADPTKNVVLIGGPAVNELVNNLAVAGDTWTADQYPADAAIIQYVADAFGTRDALVVAGYAAKDTKLAGQVLAANLLQGQFADQMTGDMVQINTAGATTVSGVTFA
jgi:hypothetical protein